MSVNNGYKRKHQHLFPIIDQMINIAVDDVEEEGLQVTCKPGCTHCCHLLVEVAWEEAVELAKWIMAQPLDRQIHFKKKISDSAVGAREIFQRKEETHKYLKPTHLDMDIPDDVFDIYFYEKVRPCPMLEDDRCVAYESRPTACRLHMVTSDPALCAREAEEEDEDYDIPDRFDELKNETEPVIQSCELDGRWGQLAILVEAALEELEDNT